MPTFIPGYLGTVTLNNDDISAIGSVVSIVKTRNVLTKPVFGSEWSYSLGGQKVANFSASGHVSAELAADLEAMFSSNEAIQFSLQVGQGGASTDAGLHSGNCIVSSFTISANADGEFDWAIEAQTTGSVTYAPAAAS